MQNGCTWNKYDGTNAWTTPGGDYNSSYIDKVGWVNNSAWYSWVLSGTGGSGTPLSLTWGSNVNILFRGLDESSGTSHMCNMDLSAGTNPPYIEITYTIVSNTFGIMGFF